MYSKFYIYHVYIIAALALFSPVALLSQPIFQSYTSGAQQTQLYFHLLQQKKIAVVANQTSLIGKTHLVDTLLKSGIDLRMVFSPEHGFRGEVSAGDVVADEAVFEKPYAIKSLYGERKKPSNQDLAGIDIVLFDIQDVGARFYTYLSTLHYVMQACAENKIPLIVLDRPNPNGNYIDGPVMQSCCTSFVGLHPVPVVYGMTIGEYALMLNGEHWFGDSLSCHLNVIPCPVYDRNLCVELPVKPSPNLPNTLAVKLYPSLCFFEGTAISVGRGTQKPFQQYGHPLLMNSTDTFIPVAMPSAANPPSAGEVCFGVDLTKMETRAILQTNKLRIDFVCKAYQDYADKPNFFNVFFSKLAGNKLLEEQIKSGLSPAIIEQTWQQELETFKQIRKKYLLYPDVH